MARRCFYRTGRARHVRRRDLRQAQTEREQVPRSCIATSTSDQLRSEVAPRSPTRQELVRRSGQSQVDETRTELPFPSVFQHDVRGFDVAVRRPGAVQVFERSPDVAGYHQRDFQPLRRRALGEHVERVTFRPLERHVGQSRFDSSPLLRRDRGRQDTGVEHVHQLGRVHEQEPLRLVGKAKALARITADFQRRLVAARIFSQPNSARYPFASDSNWPPRSPPDSQLSWHP